MDEPSRDFGKITGFIREDFAYSHQSSNRNYPFTRRSPEMTRIRTTVNLKYDGAFSPDWKVKAEVNTFYDAYYAIKGRSKFNRDTLDAYETELEIRDTYIDGKLTNDLWLRVGRQVVAWGEAEALQLVDMANPRDLREIGEVKLEDVRVPVLAAKLTYLTSIGQFDLVQLLERRPNKFATANSEFDPYIALRGSPIQVNDRYSRSHYFSESQTLARYYRTFKGTDISLIGGSVFDGIPYLEFENYDAATSTVTLTPRQKRVGFVGATASFASGTWRYRGEAAWKFNTALQRRDLFPSRFAQDTGTWLERDVGQALVGVDFTGIGDLYLSGEVGVTWIPNHTATLAASQTTWTGAFGVVYDMLHQTLHAQAYWTRISEENDQFIRLTLSYDYSDALSFIAGATFYIADSEAGILRPYRNNERVRFGIKYGF